MAGPEKKAVPDRTFEEISAFGSEEWVAARFGRSRDWLRKARAELHAAGFPKPDPIVGLTLKGDVDAWLMRRRRITDPMLSASAVNSSGQGINYDAV